MEGPWTALFIEYQDYSSYYIETPSQRIKPKQWYTETSFQKHHLHITLSITHLGNKKGKPSSQVLLRRISHQQHCLGTTRQLVNAFSRNLDAPLLETSSYALATK